MLSWLFRKNIYREIPASSSFSRQKVFADFQILLSGRNNFLHSTKLSSCTDANTNHLLSPAKTSLAKHSQFTAESQEAQAAEQRRAHLLFMHLDARSQLDLRFGKAQDMQESWNCIFSPGSKPITGHQPALCDRFGSRAHLDHDMGKGTRSPKHPLAPWSCCTPSLHSLRKGQVGRLMESSTLVTCDNGLVSSDNGFSFSV